jgi:protein subunit release factor B
MNSIELRMRALGIREEDFAEIFARSSGPGGQNVNKVSTAVTLRHLPSGISVTIQGSRSQMQNRRQARVRLLQLIEQRIERERRAAVSAREKQRRRSSPRPRALKKRILESKRRRSEIKRRRRELE